MNQSKVILEMEISAEHISEANRGNTVRPLPGKIPKFWPTDNPLSQVYIGLYTKKPLLWIYASTYT